MEEVAFWDEVYVARIRNGATHADAARAADEAVEARRMRVHVKYEERITTERERLDRAAREAERERNGDFDV